MKLTRYIEKIEVEKLFGHYNYVVDKELLSGDSDPLIIIYGDNGSGKTTLLELIFYLTSSVDNEGHKTRIAQTKFEKFGITFQGGIEIIAQRSNNSLIGSYDLIIKEHGNEITRVFLEADQEGAIRVMDSAYEVGHKYYEIMDYIKKLHIAIHYLSDSRKFIVGVEKHSNKGKPNRKLLNPYEYEMSLHNDPYSEKTNELKLSVKTLENWIKKSVLKGSKVGDKNTNSIYIDLIKRVSNQNDTAISEKKVLDLVHKLTEIRNENKLYYKYGLVSRIETKEIESTLEDPKKYNPTLIYNVLEPYVDGLQSRLDSLKDTQKVIELFVSQINSYFTNKIIKYHLITGFKIVSKEFGDSIELDMLSSGERQLLLLFCNVLTASEDASIFIIDEPEISLNIKWQRKLVRTLLEFSFNKNVQFIFASHSIELITGHSESVSKLQHIRES